MTRLIFVGAQGTGKSTILNHFKECDVPVITEVVRNLAKQGININEQGNDEGQMTIFNEYKRLLSKKKDYISDRGLFDVVAYTCYLADQGQVSQEVFQEQVNQLVDFNEENNDILYFYFPIEFPVVDDGVRSLDEEFRKRINDTIHEELRLMGVPYIEVRGTVEERIKIVEDAIKVKEAQLNH